jgi:insertion element IS1 protein InsB
VVSRDVCPRGQPPQPKKNGHLQHGKPNDHGHHGGRPLVAGCAQCRLADDPCALIARLLVERLAWRGSWRAVGGGLTGLLGFLGDGVAALPEPLHAQPAAGHGQGMMRRLEVEADARRRVGQKQADQQWLWSAMDAKSRQVLAWPAGDRRRQGAKRLWAKRPEASRPHATPDPAQDGGAAAVMPAAQPRAIPQGARTTQQRERCNTTVRPRVSPLVRDARWCSKKLARHIGAIKRCICHDNRTRAAAERALHGAHYHCLFVALA